MSSIGGFTRRQPKTKQTRRAVRAKEGKIVENPKKVLFLRGASTSEVVANALTDISLITKPYNKKLGKRNAFHPFDGQQHLEFLGFKNDCSLFCFGLHSKKRPHNIVLGRHFNFHVLDMVELGILAMDRLEMSGAKGQSIGSLGGKPLFVFEGSEFESEPTFVRLKNFLIDFFRGGNDTEINLDGCDRVILISLRSANGADACVAPDDTTVRCRPQQEKGNTVICFRHYALSKGSLPSSSAATPAVLATSLARSVQLTDIGPNFDFELRRLSLAPAQAFRTACRQPREVLAQEQSMQQNVTADALGSLRGQIHVGKQNVEELNLRRFKAHRGAGAKRAMEDNDVEENEEEAVNRGRVHLTDEKGEDDLGAATSPSSRRRKKKRTESENMTGAEVDI